MQSIILDTDNVFTWAFDICYGFEKNGEKIAQV